MGKLNRRFLLLVSLLALIFASAWWTLQDDSWHAASDPAGQDIHSETQSSAETHSHDVAGAQVYACPMHPQVRQSSQGRCPICGMDLVATDSSSPNTEHSHSEHTLQSTPPPNAQFTRAQEREISPRIRTWARIAVDATNEFVVTAPADGWVRQLYVQRAGQRVNAGEPLFEIFSPELYQRQRDYIDTMNRRDQLAQSITDMRGQNAEVLGSLARERKRQRDALLRIGIATSSIKALEAFRRPLETLAVASPYAGKVVAVDARQGLAAGPGTVLYRIVNDSTVQLDVVLTPSQLDTVQAPVNASVPAFGHDTSIPVDPTRATYDQSLQSYTLRVAVPVNTDSTTDRESAADDAARPGAVVDVDLVSNVQSVLAVPRTAILGGPDGNFVVVETGEHHFQVRKVVTGTGDQHWVGIEDGLQSGDKVVTSGQFLLDAAATFQQSFSQSVSE